MTITKTRSGSRFVTERLRRDSGESSTSYADASWSDVITYDEGPRRRDGHSVWKECHHRAVLPPETFLTFGVHRRYDWYYVDGFTLDYVPLSVRSIPDQSTLPARGDLPNIQDLIDRVYDQIDLNCTDSVLMYSGIIQAIPLLGGAMKGVSLLNRAARQIGKDLRRKPFTTVVKSLISLDFVDRFVVSPTLDDMRKFADATDYVLRVINTAVDRNQSVATAFDVQVPVSSSTDSQAVEDYAWGFRLSGKLIKRATSSSSLKFLAKVVYNAQAINPIKLWANRVGLTKPLQSAWDLVPFSFVIDYFTRAGEFIDHISEELVKDDALVGKVANIFDVWRMDKLQSVTQYELTSAQYVGGDEWSRVIELPQTNTVITAKREEFDRYRPEYLAERSGFWDGKGMISPSLSSIRARTLAELYIQSKLR